MKKLVLGIVMFLTAELSYSQWPPLPPTYLNWQNFNSTTVGPFDNNMQVATVSSAGVIYAAGSFRDGNIRPGRVAKWNGSAWVILGDRLTVPSGYTSFNAIAADAAGNVYVSGSFLTAFNADGSTIDAIHIAKWNEALQSWESVGSGTTQVAAALCIFNNDLYAGGILTAFNPGGGQVPIPRIGKWNVASSVWEPVGQGVTSFVSSMIATTTGFYMSGGFTTAKDADGTSHTVNGITFWNGASWDSLRLGLYPAGVSATDMTLDAAGSLYIVGQIQEARNGSGAGSQVPGSILKWNGSQWSNAAPQFPPTSTVVTMIETDGYDSLYAFVYNMSTFRQTLMVRRGGSWSSIGSFIGEHFAAIAGNPNATPSPLYAGGLYTQITDPSTGGTYDITNHALRAGGSWNPMAYSGTMNGIVYAFGTTPLQGSNIIPGDIYVGGLFGSVAGVPALNIAKTDGAGWSSVGRGVNGPVYAIASAAGRVFVGGSFSKAFNPNGDEIDVRNLAMWDPSTGIWSAILGGVSGTVYALDGYALAGIVRLFAGGDFDSAYTDPLGNGELVQSIVEFQTFNIPFTEWEIHKMGEGVHGRGRVVRAIGKLNTYSDLSPDGHLYIGGSFDGARNTGGNEILSPNIIRWKPADSTWSAVGQGVDDTVRAVELEARSDLIPNVWIGGNFITATDPDNSVHTVRHIARWMESENRWDSLQGWTNGPVYSITKIHSASYDGVFLGGDFTLGQLTPMNIPIEHVGLYIRKDVHEPFRPNWNIRADAGANGTNGPVYAVMSLPFCTGLGENVYVGGDFAMAGNFATGSLARWKYKWNPPVGSYSAAHVSGGGSAIGGRYSAVAPGPDCSTLSMGQATDFQLFDSLGFGERAVINNIPFGTPLTAYIFRVDGSSMGSVQIQLDAPVPYFIMLAGVDDTTKFAPNPEGKSIKFKAVVKELPVMEPDPGSVTLLCVNGVTDAPSVDVAVHGGATLVVGLSFGQAADTVVSLPPGVYTFDILRSSDGQTLGSHMIDLTAQEGEVVMLSLSGFLDPSSNQNGPALSIDEVSTGTNVLLDAGGARAMPGVPTKYSVKQNYPNPFNPSTTIRFEIPKTAHVTLTMYDLLGREIASVVDETLSPGFYERVFDGNGLASGIYFYRFSADAFTEVRKLILLQ